MVKSKQMHTAHMLSISKINMLPWNNRSNVIFRITHSSTYLIDGFLKIFHHCHKLIGILHLLPPRLHKLFGHTSARTQTHFNHNNRWCVTKTQCIIDCITKQPSYGCDSRNCFFFIADESFWLMHTGFAN